MVSNLPKVTQQASLALDLGSYSRSAMKGKVMKQKSQNQNVLICNKRKQPMRICQSCENFLLFKASVMPDRYLPLNINVYHLSHKTKAHCHGNYVPTIR